MSEFSDRWTRRNEKRVDHDKRVMFWLAVGLLVASVLIVWALA